MNKLLIILLLYSTQSFATPADYMEDVGNQILRDTETNSQQIQQHIEQENLYQAQMDFYNPKKDLVSSL